MTMTYVPSWEKKFDPWDLEPDVWDSLDNESENAKENDELFLDDVDENDLLVEFEENFDEQIFNKFSAIIFVCAFYLFLVFGKGGRIVGFLFLLLPLIPFIACGLIVLSN